MASRWSKTLGPALMLVICAHNVAADESGYFIAATVQVPQADRDSYIRHLETTALPVWQSLVDDGMLVSHTVLEQAQVVSEQTGVPPWGFLFLSRLAKGVDAQSLLASQQRRFPSVLADGSAQVMRIEVLRGTPESLHPGTPDQRQLQYFIEYIQVDEDQKDTYRNSMMANSGPAMKRLIRDGKVASFRALETVSVEFERAGMPGWNQIHVMGIEQGAAFSLADFDAAMRVVNPAGGGLKKVFGLLDEMRTKPRELVALEITMLRLPLFDAAAR